MGHEDLESTKRYTHHNVESLRVNIGMFKKMTGKLLVKMAEVNA